MIGTFDYNSLAQEAHDVILEFGAQYDIYRDTGKRNDPVKGIVTSTERNGKITAVILPPGGIQSFSQEYAGDDGAVVERNANDIIISASGLSWPPSALDEIQYKGSRWKIAQLDALTRNYSKRNGK